MNDHFKLYESVLNAIKEFEASSGLQVEEILVRDIDFEEVGNNLTMYRKGLRINVRKTEWER